MTNIEVAHAINKAVQNGDVDAVAALVTENYIQHTPVVANGRKGLIELVSKIRNKTIPAPEIRNIRTITDGDFVVLHHDVNWPSRKTMFEIFRMERGLAAEHWSGIMDHPEKTASGNSMTDGETTIADRNKTETNKKLARSFVEDVLIGGAFEKVNDYYYKDIKQHNPFIDNGITGLVRGVAALAEQGINLDIKKIWKVFGEGNFVLVCSEGEFGGKHTAFFDLFRIEGGKVAEHWDVLQEIPPPSSQAHTNGFFRTTELLEAKI
jgi:predicted SnoaL-like aldol condensation-catalyzing enzyme